MQPGPFLQINGFQLKESILHTRTLEDTLVIHRLQRLLFRQYDRQFSEV